MLRSEEGKILPQQHASGKNEDKAYQGGPRQRLILNLNLRFGDVPGL